MTVQFHHDDESSAPLVIWMHIVPSGAMHCPAILDRDSWMGFNDHFYRTHARCLEERCLGKLPLLQLGGDRPLPRPYLHTPPERFRHRISPSLYWR